MAPRGSSKRTPQPSRQFPPPRTYAEHIETAEIKRARRAAILQLRMGRLAHIVGIASGLALALTAVIAYGLVYWDFLRDAPESVTILKWLIPLVAGIVVSVAALAIKWEPYLADREEPHFVMSIIALIIPSLLIAIILLDEVDYILFGSPDWLYPASLLGICLTEISLAMTWEGTSRRKTVSITAAVFPIVLLAFPMVYHPDPETLASILPMGYLGSAVAIQLSGSMLHIIASSTSVQQREVLKASDGKLREQMIELEKKRHALAYREDALRSRESDVETYEKKLADEMASIEERKTQITALEADIEQRMQGARQAKESVAKQEAALESDRERLRIAQGDIEAQRKELERKAKGILAKEEKVSTRERETERFLLEAQAKEREIKNRLSEVEVREAQVGATEKELDELQIALAEREKQLGMRESSLDLKSLEVASAKEQVGKVAVERTTVRNLEQQLMMKQEALSEKEIQIRTMEDDIRKKSEKAERLIARADKQMNELIEKENAVIARDKSLAEKEALLKNELSALNMRLEDMQSARAAVEDKEKQYQDLTLATRNKMTELGSREDEVARRMGALAKREEKIKELEQRLKEEQEGMSAKFRELIEKEKDLQASEAEIGLKRAELKAMEQEILESVEEVEEVRAGIPEEDHERWRALELKERQLVEKEQEIKSRLYQREKELEKKERSLQAHLMKDIEEMEETVEEEYVEKKVKTGMERLDDLLVGGMPFGSNVLCVGPPFIGKEVAMMIFLAEGLKKGVPAIIVTTSKPPSEIAKEIAPILPTFMEFQQLGLVRWIDATGVEVEESTVPAAKATTIKVKGPGDFDGTIEALDKFMKAIEKQKHPYFRLLFMSLSMSITQADDKRSFQFVQSFAGRVKQANAVSLFAVERGMHTEQQLESIQHHMTGAIQFKTDKQKTLMSVQGIGDVQTRDWIEYKHTNKALMIGAFSLERIR